MGKDFSTADKGRKFSKGGDMKKMAKGGMAKSDMKEDMKMDKAQDKAMIKKAFKQHDAQEHKGGKGTNLALKKGGMPMVMKDGKKIPAFVAKKGGLTKMAGGGMAKGGGIESKGKTQGKMIKMNRGGRAC